MDSRLSKFLRVPFHLSSPLTLPAKTKKSEAAATLPPAQPAPVAASPSTLHWDITRGEDGVVKVSSFTTFDMVFPFDVWVLIVGFCTNLVQQTLRKGIIPLLPSFLLPSQLFHSPFCSSLQEFNEIDSYGWEYQRYCSF